MDQFEPFAAGDQCAYQRASHPEDARFFMPLAPDGMRSAAIRQKIRAMMLPAQIIALKGIYSSTLVHSPWFSADARSAVAMQMVFLVLSGVAVSMGWPLIRWSMK